MKYKLLLFFLLLLLNGGISAQSDTVSNEDLPVNILNADIKAKKAVIDLDNTEEKEFALKKIHTFKYLESLTIEGYSDDNALQKLLYRISALRNLTEIILSENDLEKIPDNISGLKYLQSLKIEGNIHLDYQDLFNHIKNQQIVQLSLTDNDLKKIPSAITEITSLRKLEITGNNRLDYEDLVNQLSKLQLNTLAIPVNYITELPKNIDQLRSLQILDVSNNNLTELPDQVSGLKSINRLSIQGNLLLNPAAELNKLKGANIQFLSLDKEIAAEELENIKKIFPDAEIDFPVQNLTKEPSDPNELYEDKPVVSVPKRSGELKAKKESRILSGAYLYYPTLFQGLVYNFDTLTFDERYANLGYENVYRIVNINDNRSAGIYFRKWLQGLEKPGKKDEIWFRFGNDAMVYNNYPELRAFSGMYWVYEGTLTKKQFGKKFIKSKRYSMGRRFKRKGTIVWNDIRVRFQKNNSLFTFQMKSDTGFIEFNAYPTFPNYPLDKTRQTYYKRYSLYQKSLFNRSQRFARSYRRNRFSYDASYRRLKSLAWKELQTRMSDEEKLMSKEEWLDYFDALVSNEESALNNTPLQLPFILRSLNLKGYRPETIATLIPQMNPTSNNYGLKYIEADFKDSKNNSNLPVTTIWILDNKNKKYYQASAALGLIPTPLNIKQFSNYTIMVELRNGGWGCVSSEEIDSKMFEPTKIYSFKTEVLDKNLDNIGKLLKLAIP